MLMISETFPMLSGLTSAVRQCRSPKWRVRVCGPAVSCGSALGPTLLPAPWGPASPAQYTHLASLLPKKVRRETSLYSLPQSIARDCIVWHLAHLFVNRNMRHPGSSHWAIRLWRGSSLPWLFSHGITHAALLAGGARCPQFWVPVQGWIMAG